MATEKEFRARLQQKHGTTEDWNKAENFVPKVGEIVVYDKYDKQGNQVADEVKMKIGDGVANVKDLPFFGGTANVSIEDLPLSTGSGKNSIQFGEAKANGDYSLAGGTISKDIITDILGYDITNIQDTTIIEKLGERGLFIKDRAEQSSEALGSLSVSHGAGNQSITAASNTIGIANQAGSRGFYIHKIICNSDSTLSIYLNDTQKPYFKYQYKIPILETLGWMEVNTKQEWSNSSALSFLKEGDLVSFSLFSDYMFAGTILDFNATNGEIIISNDSEIKTEDLEKDTVYPYDEDLDSISVIGKFALGALAPVDFSINFPNKPHIGIVELKFGANATGVGNSAAGNASSAYGIANIVDGTAGFVTGRENVGNWSSLVGGYKNKATGGVTFATGRSNTVKGDAAAAINSNNRALGDRSFAIGIHNITKGNNAFAGGINSIAVGNNSHAEGKGDTYLYGTDDAGKRLFSDNQIATILSSSDEAKSFWENSGKIQLTFGSASHVEGLNNLALKNNAHAEGRETIAEGEQAHTEGRGTLATGMQAHAEGYNTKALANTAHAEGSGTKATGVASHSEGISAEAKGRGSHAEGINTIATGEGQHVSGKYNIADTDSLFIIGNGSEDKRSNILTVDSEAQHLYYNDMEYLPEYDCDAGTIGTLTLGGNQIYLQAEILSGNTIDRIKKTTAFKVDLDSIYMSRTSTITSVDDNNGSDTNTASSSLQPGELKLKSDNSFVSITPNGYNALTSAVETLSADAKLSAGKKYSASGTGEIFNDYTNNIASGAYSHAEGYSTTAIGIHSHAEGHKTTTYGKYNHAEGNATKTSGECAHAEGRATVAIGNNTHAEGYQTTAIGAGAHAEGRGDKSFTDESLGLFSIDTTGNITYEKDTKVIYNKWKANKFGLAFGTAAHAEGSNTIALGTHAHAEGNSTAAVGNYSHAEGSNTIAASPYQHVQGKFNIEDDSMVHIVGWGDGESNRKNIHTINTDGNAWFSGTITVGAQKEEVVLKSELNSLDEKIGEISTILDHIIQLQEELIG